MLILHDIIKHNERIRKCEFLTNGHVSMEHGSWQLSPDGASLEAMFNYQCGSSNAQSQQRWRLHPTILDRMEDGNFAGYDDKQCEITMEHRRSLLKTPERRFWDETAPL